MTKPLNDAVDDALEKGTVTIEAGNKKAIVDVTDVDRIGVVVGRIRVEGHTESLPIESQRLQASLRPNGEPLVTTELDPSLGGSVLRSDPKHMRGRRFFQVAIDPTGSELTRHHVSDDGRRHKKDFSLTRDQLREIIDTMDGSQTS